MSDFGYYSALLGPLKTAGNLGQQRQRNELQAFQLLNTVRNQQIQNFKINQAFQNQLNTAEEAARKTLFASVGEGENNKFTYGRKKDIDDFKAWMHENSSFEDIKNILKEYNGNVMNAKLYGNLDHYMAQYKQQLQNNPIQQRTQKNLQNLKSFYKHALDKDGNARLLTKQTLQNFDAFNKGEIDNFQFHGLRGDYLPSNDEAFKAKYGELSQGQNLTAETIVALNQGAILKDMMNDYYGSDLSPQEYQEKASAFTNEMMIAYVNKELGGEMSATGVQYFNGIPLYGVKEPQVAMSQRIYKAIEAMKAISPTTVEDYYSGLEEGLTAKNRFYYGQDGAVFAEFESLGGVEEGSAPDKIGALNPFVKNRQLSATDKVFADPNVEAAVTEAWAPKRRLDGNLFKAGQDKYVSQYDRYKKKIKNFNPIGTYNDSGTLIQQDDQGLFGEEGSIDAKLNGYFIGYKVSGKVNGIPESFLLFDSKENTEKILANYKDSVIEPVLLAELYDFELVNDYYYKEVDLSNNVIAAAIDERLPSENLKQAAISRISADQQIEFNANLAEKTARLKNRLTQTLELPEGSDVDQFMNMSDKNLSVSLRLNDVPTNVINSVMPYIIGDLYSNAKADRQYPVVMSRDSNGNPVDVANNQNEYLQLSTKLFYNSISNPNNRDMLESIKQGPSAYDQWRQRNMPKKDYNKSKTIIRDIAKYYHTQ